MLLANRGDTLFRLDRIENYNPSKKVSTLTVFYKIVDNVPIPVVSSNGENLGYQYPDNKLSEPSYIVATVNGITVPVLIPKGLGVVNIYKI